jgi:hypothetical protein
MPIEDPFDHIAEIVDDMEAIGNLDCLWGAARRSLSISRTPISCQDLNTGMGFEPVRQGARRTILKQLDGAAQLFIDQDGPVRPATPLTPVVHPEHMRGSHRRQWGLRDQPQQRRATRAEAMPPSQSRSRLTAQGAREIEQQPVLGQRAPSARRGQVRQALGEDDAWAASIATEEPTNLDVQHHASTTPWKISHGALIVAMDPVRPARAERAQRRAARGVQHERQACVYDEHALEA